MKVYYSARPQANKRAQSEDINLAKAFKWCLIYHLQPLQTDIEAEGGVIVMDWNTCTIETSGFSDELDESIWRVIRSIDWRRL